MSMLSTVKGTGLAIAATTALLLTVLPAGTAEPFQIRTVTMDGAQGPAYYSRASGGYRFLASANAPARPGFSTTTATP